MMTNRPMKKSDNKWTGPYNVLEVYPRAELPDGVRIFPVPQSPSAPQDNFRWAGQAAINEREDVTMEPVEFDKLLDSHNKDGLRYLIKWRHH
jgi:hypothetical protein